MNHKTTKKALEVISLELGSQPFQFRNFLWNEYLKRSTKNPQYSLTSFSRDIGMSISHLGRVLRGQRVLRSQTAEKIVKKLPLNEQEIELFLKSADSLNKRKGKPQKRRSEQFTKMEPN